MHKTFIPAFACLLTVACAAWSGPAAADTHENMCPGTVNHIDIIEGPYGADVLAPIVEMPDVGSQGEVDYVAWTYLGKAPDDVVLHLLCFTSNAGSKPEKVVLLNTAQKKVQSCKLAHGVATCTFKTR